MEKSQEERKCLFCNNVFIVTKKSLKKFCNNSCSAKYNNPRKEKKQHGNCLCCGKELNKLNKKYCNNKCQGRCKRNKIFDKIKNGDTSFYVDAYRRYLIQEYGEKCMKCGWHEINQATGLVPIQLEHIDGNSDNNNLINLELLCPNCHSLTSTFGRLNKNGSNSKRNTKRRVKRNQ